LQPDGEASQALQFVKIFIFPSNTLLWL
jgi:hypothetical protein